MTPNIVRRVRGGFETVVPGERLDLRESLEAYAARCGMRTHDARPFWRAESLRLLNVFTPGLVNVSDGLCAMAPGVAVPTAFVDWPDDYALPHYAETRRP